MYEMKPEYYTGISTLDAEHERLFQLAEETHQLLNNHITIDKSHQVIHLVSELINYTRTHFAHEEEYMKSIQFANYEEHHAQHRQFEIKLSEIDFDELEENLEVQDEVIENLLEFLTSWLVHHIVMEDLQYAPKAN